MSSTPTIVVGASRGLGHGIAVALADTGRPVVAVSRTAPEEGRAGIRVEVADATDPSSAGRLLDRYEPTTWSWSPGGPADSPAAPADVGDVLPQLAHRRQDRVPLAARGAAHTAATGQPGGGGQQWGGAGRVSAFRWLCGGESHAAVHHRLRPGRGRSRRSGHRLHRRAAAAHPADRSGRPAVAAYAARSGQTEDDYVRGLGPVLTPEIAGKAVVELVETDADEPRPRIPAHRRRAAATRLRPARIGSAVDLRPRTTWRCSPGLKRNSPDGVLVVRSCTGG